MIRLLNEAVIAAPAERCFDLARSIDAHADSSRRIDGTAVAGRCTGLAESGDETTWSARFFGLRFRLTTRISEYDRPCRFCDTMTRGLFRHFGHVYTFEPLGPNQTRLTDAFTFESPFGFAGAWFDQYVLRPVMQTVARERVEWLKRVAEGDGWHRYVEPARTTEGQGT